MGTSVAPAVPSPDSFELTRRAWDALVADREMLGLPDLTVTPLADFLKAAEDPEQNPHQLSASDRIVVLDQAEILIRDLYPHLFFKQKDFKDAIPPVDPLYRIHQLRTRVQSGTGGLPDLGFHLEMLKIFASVRDPHTAYALPQYFHGAVAFLPFRVGCCEDPSGKTRYIVTSVMKGFEHPDFKPGAELVSSRASSDLTDEVDRAAQLSPGANKSAQHLRGVMRLTLRSLATAGTGGWRDLAEAVSATFHYKGAGSSQRHSISFPWGVARGAGLHQEIPGQAFSIAKDLSVSHSAAAILWNRAPQASPQSVFPDVFEFQTEISAFGKQFGYVAVKSFSTPSSADLSSDLPNEFARILRLLQATALDGLIVDIRGNPGGDIVAAESMLQMLTARPIEPANFHLANTEATQNILKIIAADTSISPDLRAWAGSAESVPLPHGEPLTLGQPLTTSPNTIGQIYQGPVVLLVDALTYSAADIFAGGFSDNRIGKVISPDASTGGGGASVWPHNDIVARLPAGTLKLQPLPHGTDMSLAMLRSSRVGPSLGQPIEDVGVHPDIIHPRSLEDLLAGDSGDLISHACATLAEMPVHRIEITEVQQTPDGMATRLNAINLDRLEFTLDQDQAPILKVTAGAASSSITVPFHPGGFVPAQMVIHGFSGDELVASARMVFEVQTANRRRRSD